MIVQGRSSVILEADHAGQHEHITPTGETTTVLVQDGDPIEVPIFQCTGSGWTSCETKGTIEELNTTKQYCRPCMGA